ncbi:hypothetical protein [Tessaracoccus massiliensis]|uniref:hypothetical protein n=1 Tax=Tessaracoccus massiliensis TaxID=1522311 RepID=UPI00058EEE83|nr:hypothetical protein [Tessaracoccus massiliensis]
MATGAGTLASTWDIGSPSSETTLVDPARTQVRLPTGTPLPGLLGPALRLIWRDRLAARVALVRHDALTHAVTPPSVAAVYRLIPETPTVSTLRARVGEQACRDALEILQERSWTTIQPLPPPTRDARIELAERSVLDRAARERGVEGFLERRAQRYRLESVRWAWLHVEIAWLRAPKDHKTGRRADGTPDHQTAMRLLQGEAHQVLLSAEQLLRDEFDAALLHSVGVSPLGIPGNTERTGMLAPGSVDSRVRMHCRD